MDWLKKLWASLKHPLEEAIKLMWTKTSQPYHEKPERLFGSMPDGAQKTAMIEFAKTEFGAAILGQVLDTVDVEVVKLLDKIDGEIG